MMICRQSAAMLVSPRLHVMPHRAFLALTQGCRLRQPPLLGHAPSSSQPRPLKPVHLRLAVSLRYLFPPCLKATSRKLGVAILTFLPRPDWLLVRGFSGTWSCPHSANQSLGSPNLRQIRPQSFACASAAPSSHGDIGVGVMVDRRVIESVTPIL